MKFYKSEYGIVIDGDLPVFKVTRFLFCLLIIGYLCVSLLIGTILLLWHLSVPFVLILVVLLSLKVCTEIDTKRSRLRQGFRIFGRTLASWDEVNEFSYLSIFPTLGTKNSAMPIVTSPIGTSIQLKDLRLNLVVNNRTRVILQSDMKLDKDRTSVIKLGEALGLGVYDCTGQENIWLRPRS